VAKILNESSDRVDGYISKYMEILDVDGKPPRSKVINSPGSGWLARAKWNLKRPEDTTLEFQKALFKNDKNDDWLERSVAHEMIHYRDVRARAADPEDRVADPSQHGPSFHEGADRINKVMGRDFVTDAAVKLPTGTFLSMTDLKAMQSELRKMLTMALGVGGLMILAILLGKPQASSTTPNDRGHYGRRR